MCSFIRRSERRRGGLQRGSALAGGLLLVLVVGCDQSPRPQTLAKCELMVGAVKTRVEVARTGVERRTGMMHRRRIGPDEGMLFVFPGEEVLTFYMKNTHVPLSIAFIRSDGTIDRIAGMAPQSLAACASRRPCRYALEMPQGWFSKHGVWEGDRVAIPSGLKAAD